MPEGPIPLQRDAQQWVFDWVVQQTGKVFHFQGADRGPLPPTVRTHAMISKELGRRARRLKRIAEEEAAAGHQQTAMDVFFDAAGVFANAQHVVFENNDEKRYLHGESLACFEEVRRRCAYPIERVEVEVGDGVCVGNLHIEPGLGRAPVVVYLPGCDMTKEMYPHPRLNHAHQRGMHLLSFDGPGQGESNLRDLVLTPDNYERAAAAAIDLLCQRPEIDAGRVVVYGHGFGSYWGARLVGLTEKVRAFAGLGASICDPSYLFERDSPRFKQLFAYLTRARTEAELDEFVAQMDASGSLAASRCPVLVISGEYDPRNDIAELERIVAGSGGPSELWVFADQHHLVVYPGDRHGGVWDAPGHLMVLDWLADQLATGEAAERSGHVTRFIDTNTGGPYGRWQPEVRWFA